MSRVLILTHPGDLESFAVKEALKRRGSEAVLWYGTDFPSQQQASISVTENGMDWEISGPDLDIAADSFDAVWNRRPMEAVLPGYVHSADRPFAVQSCRHFVRSLWRILAPGAFWVNPIDSFQTAVLKPLQMRAALKAGLTLPPTLFSNDPARIRSFLRRYRGRTVYKGFGAGSWSSEAGPAVLFTAPVSEADLPEDPLLQASPGIFQVLVAKAFELRVTFIGDRPHTARLLSQEVPAARDDWRSAFPDLQVEIGDLPDEVAAGCRRLMKELGIVFGGFDFIVTPERRYVFLEVNQMGQFLFLEGACPDLLLLDPFCELLVQRRIDFEWRCSPHSMRLEEVREAAKEAARAASEQHVARPTTVVDERES